MKKAALIFIIICSTCTTPASAQRSAVDSIRTSLKTDPNFFLGFHNRNTFILTNKTRLYGIIGGLNYNDKVLFYAGIYGFGRANETRLSTFNEFNADSVLRYTSVSNFSIGAAYVYYKQGRISLSVPIQIGIGNAEYSYENEPNRSLLATRNYAFVPIETGTNAYIELLPWAGIKAGLGYRMHLGAKPARRLNSPYYNLGLAISLRPIIDAVKD